MSASNAGRASQRCQYTPVKILGLGCSGGIERDLEPCLGKGWLKKS
jgi:hypothetical protein